MKRFTWAVAMFLAAGVATAGIARAADEKKADAPKEASTEKPAKKAKAVRLTKPWNGISSLTDEQKAQIDTIHKKKVEDVKELERKEKEAIMALLNDQQKAEVQAMTEKATAEGKMKKDSSEKPAETPKK
jgi:Spy/CpxP family protein refolding chaperone